MVDPGERWPRLIPPPSFDTDVLRGQRKDSRSAFRRQLRLHHSLGWANEAISTLTHMAGFGASADPKSVRSLATVEALGSIAECFHSLGGPPAGGETTEGAFRALLTGAAADCQELQDLAPYAKDQMSCPPGGQAPLPLLDHLRGADRERLPAWKQCLLREPNEAKALKEASGITRPCCDPALFRDPRVYPASVEHLSNAGMLRLSLAQGRSGTLGNLYNEKSGQRRLICDTCILKLELVGPASVSLPTAAAFSSSEVSEGGECLSCHG